MSIYPSIRLSVQYSIETAKHTIKLLSPQGSHIILVFLYQTVLQYSDGESPNGGVECRGLRNRDFRPISRFISETIQHRAIVAMTEWWQVVYGLSNSAIFNDPERPLILRF